MAQLTDTAIDRVSGPLGLVLGGRIATPTHRGKRLDPYDVNSDDLAQLALPEPSEGIIEHAEIAAPAAPSVQGTDDQYLARIFRYDGNHVRLDDSRLKAASKQDAVRRLTYLTLYAMEELGSQQKIPRTELIEVIKDAGLYDSNTAKVFRHTADLFFEGDSVGLRLPGRDQAKEFLRQINDSEIPNVWSPSTSVRGRSKGGNTDEEEAEKAPRGGRRTPTQSSKTVDGYVKAWRALELPVHGHEILKDRSVADKGIVALWAIRRALGDEGKIVSRDHLAEFILQAFELKVHGRSLQRALASAKDKVLGIGSTKFQINQTGIAHAERLVGVVQEREASGISTNGAAINRA